MAFPTVEKQVHTAALIASNRANLVNTTGNAPFVIYQWAIPPEVFMAVWEYAKKHKTGMFALWERALNFGRFPSWAQWGTGLVAFSSTVRDAKAVIVDQLLMQDIPTYDLFLFPQLRDRDTSYVVLTSRWSEHFLLELSKWYAKTASRVLKERR